MSDGFWNQSDIQEKVQRQGIFASDTNNDLERFKTRSDPLIERLIDSSRETAAIDTSGVPSARFRPTVTHRNPMPTPTPPPPSSSPALIPMKISIIESARRTRSPAPTSTQENLQWQPHAEDFPDNSVKDRSTQYDQQMKLRCQLLLQNKPVDLSDIREYDQKASLLRVAVELNIPNVTVPVMNFLENSLSRAMFYQLIKQQPSAVRNYINKAKLRLENDYYIGMLKQFEQNEDVAMIRIEQASQTDDVNTKIVLLDRAATELGSHPWWQLQVAEQRQWLNKQRDLQMSSSSNTRSQHRTVLETFKALYENEFRRQKSSRPGDKLVVTPDRSKEFEVLLHMSPELVLCGKLSVIMHCGLQAHYDDFVHQAIHQSLFGRKYIIAPEYLADMVYNWVRYTGENQEKANERTARFLHMIADPDKRIYYAEKLQNFDVAMDTIVNVLRDRMQLEILRKRMPHDNPSYHRATSLLENTKWRN